MYKNIYRNASTRKSYAFTDTNSQKITSFRSKHLTVNETERKIVVEKFPGWSEKHIVCTYLLFYQVNYKTDNGCLLWIMFGSALEFS